MMTDPELEKYGAPAPIDPGIALMKEVYRSNGHVLWLERKVREIEESQMFWQTVREQTESGVLMGKDVEIVRREAGAVQNYWWQMYKQEREHLARISAVAIKAGIEERRVRLAESSVERLEQAVLNALSDLGLDPSSALVRKTVGARLAEALGGDPATSGLATGAVAALTGNGSADGEPYGVGTVDGTVVSHGHTVSEPWENARDNSASAAQNTPATPQAPDLGTPPSPVDF